jgi:hypothetical protein
MLAEAVVISLIIGLIFRGSLNTLSTVPVKQLYLPIVAFALEMLGAKLLHMDFDYLTRMEGLFTFAVEVVVNGLLIYFFYINFSIRGMKCIFAGSILNFVVIICNGGYMPVDPSLGIQHGFTSSLELLENGKIFAHELMSESTKLRGLADWIMIPPPWPFPKTISLGDILIDIGTFVLIFTGMNAGQSKKISV